ncbi:TMEM175 family protein [Roseixanthobacter liquoris]|uniref:TMEM175 family protein n=1 Tax=Roseixanthobacter liquoris TaxID=3119921 RepID=UPI00372991BC
MPATRIDALTDGIFAFAMTLLVLEIRLPDDLPIGSSADLVAHLRTLGAEYVTYLISFFVLAALWRGNISLRHKGEEVSHLCGRIWLFYLFFITSVPFSSSVVGHYGQFAPAVWLYAANMMILGLLSMLLVKLETPPARKVQPRPKYLPLLLFTGSAAISALISLADPHYAMYAYLLNGLSRFLPAPAKDPAHPPAASAEAELSPPGPA